MQPPTPNKLIKKIGTGQLGKPANSSPREDQTSALDSLRNSLGANSTLPRGHVLQGRYEVEQVVGYGGMSTVYRARDLRFTQTVRICAVKEMFDVSTDPAGRRDKLARFEMEANMLAKLNHVSIPKIYEYFEADGRSYLILEYVDGKNLETALEQAAAPLEESDVLEWSIQLCDVLGYLHNQKPAPVVFRDMKPSNVMLNSDGRLMLIDFGIAKVFLDEKKGTMIGTEGYSPPEQYKGEAKPAGDIYALGATMHHLLTNSDPRLEIPFTFHERMPRALNPKISPEIEAIVMKALGFRPEERWANIEEMKNAMLRLKLSKSGMMMPVSSNLGQATRELNIDINNIPDITVVSTTSQAGNPSLRTAVPAAEVGMAVHRENTNAAKDAPITAPANLPVAKMLWSFPAEEELRSTPVVFGNMVFIGSYDTNIYALDAKNGQFLWKTPTEGGIASTPIIAEVPGVPPMLIVGSDDHKLYALDIQRGQKLWDFSTGGPVRSSPRLHQAYAFFGSDDNHIYGVDIRGGKQLWKTRTMGKVRSSPAIANAMIYIGSEDRRLYSLEASKGQINWRYDTLQGIISSPAVAEGFVYVGSDDGNLYCIDIQTGYQIWKAKTENKVRTSPCVVAGKVYFASADGNVYCYDAKRGTKQWVFKANTQIASSPKVANGLVFFGGADGNVYALDAEKGHARWFYPTEAPITSTPTIANNILYIGSLDKRLYALAIQGANSK